MHIDRHTFNEIIRLLKPHVTDVPERIALVSRNFFNSSLRDSIQYSGSATVFATLLLTKLMDYGDVENLLLLLEYIDDQTGSSSSDEIERLKAIIQSDEAVTEPRRSSGGLDVSITGQRLDHFIVGSKVGSGGFGVVYEAIDTRDQQKVAIKIVREEVLRTYPKLRYRFDREINLIQQLDHDHIVKLKGSGQTAKGLPYFAMQWLGGGNLRQKFARIYGPMTIGDVSAMLSQIAPALYSIHKAHIVHRDIKPENIMLDVNERYYIGDFGIAKPRTNLTKLTSTGTVLGTLDYAAPEQLEGVEIDHRADIYSIGIVLYEALTGHAPFKSLEDRFTKTIPSVSAFVSQHIQQIDIVLQKATARDRDLRYKNIWQLDREFQDISNLPG